MSYLELVYIHLATVVPAFIIGTILLLSRKGSRRHKMMGIIYMILMLVTAVVSLFLQAQVGPVFLDHFGYIHLLSLLTIYTVFVAYISAKNGNVKRHSSSMIGLYIGGILLAGSFAFTPGRHLHSWLFS